MPCRGKREFVEEAIHSLLAQHEREFQAIIIDDASEDETASYLQSIKDSRFRIIRNEQPLGVAISLNRGLKETGADVILRMDADDIAEPNRLEVQLAAFENNLGHVIGCHVTLLQEDNTTSAGDRIPLQHEAIAYRFCWSNAMKHPTIAFLRRAVEDIGGYDETLPVAQDYDLWTRLIFRHRFANLKSRLVRYRQHEAQATRQKREELERVRAIIRNRYRARITGTTPPEIFDHISLWHRENIPTFEQWEIWLNWLETLQRTFKHRDWTFASVQTLDVRRDIARRIAHAILAAKELRVEIPPQATKIAKHLAPFYSFFKGI